MTSRAEPPHGRQRRVLLVVAGILVLGFGGSLVFSGLQSSSRAASPAPPETSFRAIRVLGIRPRPGAEDVSFDASITVRLSAAPRTSMPSPRLSPPVSGTWTSLRGVLLVFHPSASYLPDTTYRLEIALASRTWSRSWYLPHLRDGDLGLTASIGREAAPKLMGGASGACSRPGHAALPCNVMTSGFCRPVPCRRVEQEPALLDAPRSCPHRGSDVMATSVVRDRVKTQRVESIR